MSNEKLTMYQYKVYYTSYQYITLKVKDSDNVEEKIAENFKFHNKPDTVFGNMPTKTITNMEKVWSDPIDIPVEKDIIFYNYKIISHQNTTKMELTLPHTPDKLQKYLVTQNYMESMEEDEYFKIEVFAKNEDEAHIKALSIGNQRYQGLEPWGTYNIKEITTSNDKNIKETKMNSPLKSKDPEMKEYEVLVDFCSYKNYYTICNSEKEAKDRTFKDLRQRMKEAGLEEGKVSIESSWYSKKANEYGVYAIVTYYNWVKVNARDEAAAEKLATEEINNMFHDIFIENSKTDAMQVRKI